MQVPHIGLPNMMASTAAKRAGVAAKSDRSTAGEFFNSMTTCRLDPIGDWRLDKDRHVAFASKVPAAQPTVDKSVVLVLTQSTAIVDDVVNGSSAARAIARTHGQCKLVLASNAVVGMACKHRNSPLTHAVAIEGHAVWDATRKVPLTDTANSAAQLMNVELQVATPLKLGEIEISESQQRAYVSGEKTERFGSNSQLVGFEGSVNLSPA